MQKGFTDRTCEVCGIKFERQTTDVQKGLGRFCSRKCCGIWISKNMVGRHNGNWRGGWVDRTCEVCGKIFKIGQSVVKKGNGKLCSLKCSRILKSQTNIGKTNPNWKGGISPSVMKIRSSIEYKEWRKQVFKRDNFTCQKCGIKRVPIHAHHKKRFSVIMNDIRQQYPLLSVLDVANNYPRLWDIDNGITLCKDCHKQTHKKNKSTVDDVPF